MSSTETGDFNFIGSIGDDNRTDGMLDDIFDEFLFSSDNGVNSNHNHNNNISAQNLKKGTSTSEVTHADSDDDDLDDDDDDDDLDEWKKT